MNKVKCIIAVVLLIACLLTSVVSCSINCLAYSVVENFGIVMLYDGEELYTRVAKMVEDSTGSHLDISLDSIVRTDKFDNLGIIYEYEGDTFLWLPFGSWTINVPTTSVVQPDPAPAPTPTPAPAQLHATSVKVCCPECGHIKKHKKKKSHYKWCSKYPC